MATSEETGESSAGTDARSTRLENFTLYANRSEFYLVGCDSSREQWRVMRIDRSLPAVPTIYEFPVTYSESECRDLLERLDHGNIPNGRLNQVTECYGIVGFVKFLGPYYMILITGRKKIGTISGHSIYAVSKSKMIALSDSAERYYMSSFKDEKRCKRLLCSIDLTKDFFFSYSYNIMCSLQKNMCDSVTGKAVYKSMFVWNEFLTRSMRNHLKNSTWIVPLVHGFFKQDKISCAGNNFIFTLIARRSRDFAGTRYLRRGVDQKGRAANDVETEQIVFDDNSEEIPRRITSVVQNRGSIPLFWSQAPRRLQFKPDIILGDMDDDFEATRLHFDDLVDRYRKPIILLSLIKEHEKKPRESLLHKRLEEAINHINRDLLEEDRLIFCHWDFKNNCRRKHTEVLSSLGKLAASAMDMTGFFHCQLTANLGVQDSLSSPILLDDKSGNNGKTREDDLVISENGTLEDKELNSDISQNAYYSHRTEQNAIFWAKPNRLQNGVLRTNCIDCLDRTNAAQIVHGLTALGHQLHALRIIHVPEVDFEGPLADDLKMFYRQMGNRLAVQYAGSIAHDKVPSKRSGLRLTLTLCEKLVSDVQRCCSHFFLDARKQEAIDLFLGHSVLQQVKLSKQHSYQQYNVGMQSGDSWSDEHYRSSLRRSKSESDIHEVTTHASDGDAGEIKHEFSNLCSYSSMLVLNGSCSSSPRPRSSLIRSQSAIVTDASDNDAGASNNVSPKQPLTFGNGCSSFSRLFIKRSLRFTKKSFKTTRSADDIFQQYDRLPSTISLNSNSNSNSNSRRRRRWNSDRRGGVGFDEFIQWFARYVGTFCSGARRLERRHSI